jgi:hypothetical protein
LFTVTGREGQGNGIYFHNGRPEGRKAMPAWIPAVSDFLEFARSANSERRKNGMDAVALGRQDVGCFQSLGFLRSKNPRPKNDMHVIFGQRKG